MTTTLSGGLLGGILQKPNMAFSLVVGAIVINLLATRAPITDVVWFSLQLMFAYAASFMGFLFTDRILEIRYFFDFENNYRQMVCTFLAMCFFILSLVAYELMALPLNIIYTALGMFATAAFLWGTLVWTLPPKGQKGDIYPFYTSKSVAIFMGWGSAIVTVYLAMHFLLYVPTLAPNEHYWTEFISLCIVAGLLALAILLRRVSKAVKHSSA